MFTWWTPKQRDI